MQHGLDSNWVDGCVVVADPGAAGASGRGNRDLEERAGEVDLARRVQYVRPEINRQGLLPAKAT